ncbi:MAG: YggS family pyridoxal phosphate-dependent enzyme [Treponema sp.]
MAISDNIKEIKMRMFEACQRCGRKTDEVRLLLATKTVPPSGIIEAFNAGETLIGENKVQELVAKAEELMPFKHESHFIGHLQSNKIKDVLKYADCIQSVDRLELAQKLEKKLEAENRALDIFIQVNTSKEESKFGCKVEEAIPLIEKVSEFSHLNIKGLMTIGLFSDDLNLTRPCFKALYKIKIEAEALGCLKVKSLELSMGMSGDFEMAIEEGATIVRVGTSIFGKRVYPDSYYWNENK